MAKKSRASGEHKKSSKSKQEITRPFAIEERAVDATLAALFASSAGPVQAPSKSRYSEAPSPANRKVAKHTEVEESEDAELDGGSEPGDEDGDDDENLSSVEGDIEDAAMEILGAEEDLESDESVRNPALVAQVNDEGTTFQNKRKRKSSGNGEGDDIEGQYMLKLQREEEKEEEERQAERRLKRQRTTAEQGVEKTEEEQNSGEDDSDSSAEEENEGDVKPSEAPFEVPLHESMVPAVDKETSELEKASRTVFLANVSTACITDKSSKKTLMDHMGSFIDSLPPPRDGKPVSRVESIRFRSTAYASTLPKKASFATKSLMDATTRSTNAYVVYTTSYAAREAVKRLNASVVLDRHLRVDGVAHPSKTDHRRCVFVGNLGFVDDESLMDQGGEDQRKRSKIPSDIEEGLWRQFGKAGKVESVRVVRDEKTRVGKGFAYVQFEDANSVEAALLFNEKKYPPMLPRVLRVTRAKAMAKTALASQRAKPQPQRPQPGGANNPNNQAIFNPKMSAQQQSLQGRASKLLGKAGAAQFKKREDGERPTRPGMEGLKTPENVVMEGYRASAKNGKPKDLKFGKGGKKSAGKPAGRSSKRGADWKKSGGKKTK